MIAVKFVFLVLWSTCSINSVYGEIFYGVGRIMWSNKWTISDGDSIKIVYRPENYEKYSPERGGVVRLSKLVLAQAYTYAAAKKAKDDQIFTTDSHVMNWSFEGKYYYYIGEEDLETGQYISTRIQLHDSLGVTVYSDSGTHAIDGSTDCDIEKSTGAVSDPCSDIFNDDSFWYGEGINEDSPGTSTSSSSRSGVFTGQVTTQSYNILVRSGDDNGLSKGGLAAAISIPLIIIIIIVIVVAVILLRRKNSLAAGSSNQPPNSGEAQQGATARFNPRGQTNLAVSQSSATQQTMPATIRKEGWYETPMFPQTSNVYEVLPPPRVLLSQPPAPPPFSVTAAQAALCEESRRKPPPPPHQILAFGSQASPTTDVGMYCGHEASAPPDPEEYTGYDDVTVGHPEYYPPTECYT